VITNYRQPSVVIIRGNVRVHFYYSSDHVITDVFCGKVRIMFRCSRVTRAIYVCLVFDLIVSSTKLGPRYSPVRNNKTLAFFDNNAMCAFLGARLYAKYESSIEPKFGWRAKIWILVRARPMALRFRTSEVTINFVVYKVIYIYISERSKCTQRAVD